MNSVARNGLYCLVIGVALTAAPRICAQDWNAASMFYGHGVHAFFAGQYAEAEQSLARAIQSNPNDPRSYYFRAMCLLRLGREPEAREDMQIGAAIEATRPHRYAIGTSLERVQGSDRLILEQYRRQARLDEAAHRDNRNRSRYEQVTGQEGDVLRRSEVLPLEQLAPPADTRKSPAIQPVPSTPTSPMEADADQPQGASEADSSVDPFADDQAPSVEFEAEAAPADDLPAASDKLEVDIFSDSTAAGETAEELDQEDDAPAEEIPSEAEDEDPFGDF